MKHILSVQDLSCMGKCSLAVALPVISAMSCTCSVLPTAILSTHTAFPDPHIRSLTEDMDSFCRHWQKIGAKFDTVSVGYLSDPAQAAKVEQVLDTFPAHFILDPVMGDRGKLYSGITPEHIQAMKKLIRRCDVLLPNITEAAYLTGLSYRQTTDAGYYQELLAGLSELGAKTVVLTGVCLQNGDTGFQLSTGAVYQTKKLPGHFHGTGDLFAAVFAGGYAPGKELFAATKAAKFVERVIAATGESSPFGVAFEPQLSWLSQQ